MTMLDRRVAQIYVSTDSRTHGNTYNSYVLAMMEITSGRGIKANAAFGIKHHSGVCRTLEMPCLFCRSAVMQA
jgi:hypothetical protein